jgi:hypothetical protein
MPEVYHPSVLSPGGAVARISDRPSHPRRVVLVMLRVCAIPEGLVFADVSPLVAIKPVLWIFRQERKTLHQFNQLAQRRFVPIGHGARPSPAKGPHSRRTLRELRKLCIVRRGAALFLAADVKGAHGSLYE